MLFSIFNHFYCTVAVTTPRSCSFPAASHTYTTTTFTLDSVHWFMPERRDCGCRFDVSASPAAALQIRPRHNEKKRHNKSRKSQLQRNDGTRLETERVGKEWKTPYEEKPAQCCQCSSVSDCKKKMAEVQSGSSSSQWCFIWLNNRKAAELTVASRGGHFM